MLRLSVALITLIVLMATLGWWQGLLAQIALWIIVSLVIGERRPDP